MKKDNFKKVLSNSKTIFIILISCFLLFVGNNVKATETNSQSDSVNNDWATISNAANKLNLEVKKEYVDGNTVITFWSGSEQLTFDRIREALADDGSSAYNNIVVEEVEDGNVINTLKIEFTNGDWTPLDEVNIENDGLDATTSENSITISGTDKKISLYIPVYDEEEGENVIEYLAEPRTDASWGEIIGGIVTAPVNWALDTLGGIFNNILISIADRIHELINLIFGSEEPLTVYQVIFGKIDKLNINFWGGSSSNSGSNSDESNGAISGGTGLESGETLIEDALGIVDTSPVTVLKDVVNYWYGVLKGVAISIYLVMLLYIGVRILLASTTSSLGRYKELLTSWVLGIIILLLFPIVMQYVVRINESFVNTLDSDVINLDSDGDGVPDDVMSSIRQLAEEEGSIALTVVYIIMLGQLIVLLCVYYKRVFMVAFLITIFPIVATLYIWEKVGKGSARSFSNWTKEYVIVIMTQTFHAVVYVVLIEGAFGAFRDSNNWLMYIFCVTFLFKAEGIIRSIFGMSSTKAAGELAATGAAAWTGMKAVKNMFKPSPKKSTEDEKDLKEVSNDVEERKKQTYVNNRLSETLTENGMTSTSKVASNAATNLKQDNTPANLDAAQAYMTQEGLKDRTKKSIVSRALGFTGNTLARGAGITLGITSGLASGDLAKGVANAVVFNEFAGMASNVVGSITGFVKGAYAGQVLKMKVRSGEMDDKLRELGFDLDAEFDPDPIINSKKAEIFREALAQQIAGARSGGMAKGEVEFIKSVDKGRKKENI